MTAEDQQRIHALVARRDRVQSALKTFRTNGDIRGVLEPEEFEEVRLVANTATENKLVAMEREARHRLESEAGQ